MPQRQMSQEATAEDDDFGDSAETYYDPKVVDPRDRFSIPSQELRKEKFERLQKAQEDKEKEKRAMEAAHLERNSKIIVEKNKNNVRQNESKFNKLEK